MRVLRCLLLLWWFFRFDPESGRIVPDGGHDNQATCEAHAANFGYLTQVITARPVFSKTGQRLGQWQNACWEDNAGLRPGGAVIVR